MYKKGAESFVEIACGTKTRRLAGPCSLVGPSECYSLYGCEDVPELHDLQTSQRLCIVTISEALLKGRCGRLIVFVPTFF